MLVRVERLVIRCALCADLVVNFQETLGLRVVVSTFEVLDSPCAPNTNTLTFLRIKYSRSTLYLPNKLFIVMISHRQHLLELPTCLSLIPHPRLRYLNFILVPVLVLGFTTNCLLFLVSLVLLAAGSPVVTIDR